MSATELVAGLDPCDATLVRDISGGLLGAFNRAGVLLPADVHTAARLARLGGETDELVALAVALAVRAPRVGHVSVDLTTVRTVAAADVREDVDLDAQPWPEPTGWMDRVAASPLVAVGEEEDSRPLRLIGTALYLDRYWRDELTVARDLRARASADPAEVDGAALAGSLARLFARGDDDQEGAVSTAVRRRFTVIAGGPGTGKTTTVARLLAAVHEQAEVRGERPPLVALAAPTGKAAARLEEAVHAEAARFDVSDEVRDRLTATAGSTLHRLLGSRPGTSRFRHHAGNRLPHDVIVVDEASMLSLELMARLVDAARPDARLLLVGDPEQLVSVEAGAVLADIVGSAVVPAAVGGSPMAASIARLRTNHRFVGALADLAAAVRAGDADAAVDVLRAGDAAVAWLPDDPLTSPSPLREEITRWAGHLIDAARHSDERAALEELSRHRVLCAHRRGPAGVTAWNDQIERWLAGEWPDLEGEGLWYAGRPVLMTSNDYSLRLFNGDTGVTIAGASRTSARVSVAFDDGAGRSRSVSPSRLADVETVYAMTVHKSQGSEFDQVTLLLPAAGSRLLTRELLYTAVTRAKRGLLVAGTEDAVRAAVSRPIARVSGLTDRLWRQR
ncbi:MAG: exodeoxyribonuclease V subunit alpha [Acidimicrobiales bacterium]